MDLQEAKIFIEEKGKTLTLIKEDKTEITISGIVDENKNLSSGVSGMDGVFNRGLGNYGTILIAGDTAKPKYQEVIKEEDKNWTVEQVEKKGAFWKIYVSSDVRRDI